MNNLTTEQSDALKSLDLITLAITFAFKWNKVELMGQISDWMQQFATSMNESEKNEFVQKLQELGIK